MGLTKTVLRRPVATVMLVLCLIVFGFRSIMSARLQQMPDMDYPMLIIYTLYTGASPEDINDLVTTEIEDEIGSLSGIDTVTGYSMENISLIIISYDYDKDTDEAYNDLQQKMDQIKAAIPDDCEDPMVIKMNIDEMAAITLAIDNKTQSNLYNYVNNKIVPEIEKITSVADVSVSGGQEQYIQIELIPEKLEQYGLTMSSVASSVGAADFSYPVGDTIVGDQLLDVSAGAEYNTTELLKKIPISLGSGNIIYLEDIANVGLALEDAEGVARYNGNDTISIEVTKQQSATAMEVSSEVKEVMAELQAADPNLEVIIVDDTSETIISSLSSVFQTMIMAVIVSMLIIFLFFGEIRASLIVGTSIPISILAALVLMQLMDFSLNVVTLSSLVLGVGMMVDNSIVVLESCFRSTKGKELAGYRDAALEGSGIVLQSIIGSTVTTCVVFLPLAMMTGLSAMMFTPLGFTIVFCMVASLVSAMTIVPLCYCYFRPREKEDSPVGGIVRALQKGYRSLMDELLEKKRLVIAVSILCFAVSIWMATQLRMELIVSDDIGQIDIDIEMRPGLSVEEQDRIFRQVEEYITQDPDLESYLLSSGGSGLSTSTGTSGTLNAYLLDKRSREMDEVMKEWKRGLADVTGANLTFSLGSSMSTVMSTSDGAEYVLQSTQYDDLKAASDAIVAELQTRPEITKVHSTMENSAPVVKVDIDSVKATAEGVTPALVASSLNNILDGIEATTMKVDGEDISVMVEYAKDQYDTIDKLQGIMLTSSSGTSVALTDVADIYFKDSPATILRSDGQYQVTITGDFLTEDSREQDAIEDLLYDEVVTKYMGSTVVLAESTIQKMMRENFSALGGAIALAVFLVFVVMAMQFESPKFSLMVMTTIPFALIGSFVLLYLTDVSISMTSLLGFLMLVGTVVNNGILYVDTVNQLRSEMEMKQALIEAGAIRMRPIFMTTLTTIVAMIPMALAFGDSGATMQGLAIVDVGGLLASTALALLVLPIYYAVMSVKPKKEISYD
ncbi:MAG: efflux RND transporter permease subunit [Clostridiales bacterium]|nr:efflux RND transporter permease subunit [Clostridiales bacterium]